ncbi:MAG: S8 family peptidase [Candidatus Eremiobacteraeota bacterium]|nr:S8 family peptidase [Candidatus Eremiobacteraeota bacterium]
MDAAKISPLNQHTAHVKGVKAPPPEAAGPAEARDEVALTGKAGAKEEIRVKEYGEHVPGELLVRFKGAVPSSLEFRGIRLEVIKKYDLPETMKSQGNGDICHVKILSDVPVKDAVKSLEKDRRIAYAEPNFVIRLPKNEDDAGPAAKAEGNGDTPPATPGEGPQVKPDDLDRKLWGLDNTGQTGGKADADIDAPEAWNIATGAGGPLIAVIDTGVDYTHPDLKNNIWTNPGEIAGDGIDNDGNGYVDDVHGYDFANKDGDPMDDHSHGTHCAGTIAAEGDNKTGVVGVNWQASIMPLKFIKGSGGGTTADAIEAVIYATRMGARITSNSWGGGEFSQALKDAIDGFPGLFVAAAGNSSADNDKEAHYPSSYESPNILAVASSDHRDRLSSFSNYGKTTVDLAAPGSSIYSTVPGGGYGSKSGTSMATPHVAGAAGLVASHEPDISASQLKERLMQTTDAVPEFNEKMVTGGRLNVHKALLAGGEAPKEE